MTAVGVLYNSNDPQTLKHVTSGVNSIFVPKGEPLLKCEIRNANCERVLFIIDKFLKDRYSHACCCMKCFSDAAAIALNLLPPHYYAGTDGAGDYGSPWVMVETAVAEAMERVMENPRHEKTKRGGA